MHRWEWRNIYWNYLYARRRGGMIMTDHELLEVLMEKMDANQSQINNVELKIDQFIKEYKEIMYEYGEVCKNSAKPSCWW